MKKILSLVLAALMVFSMVPAIFAEEVADTTAAVEEVSEYQAAIDFLKLLGIYVGTSEDSFVAAAKEPVNRAQMALFTSRFITGQVDPAYWMTSENDSGFTDVDDLYEEAIGAISFASQKGIVNGVGEGLFDPETGVQYREAITMIVRALGYTYKASGYPWSYINKARELGLLDGIANIGYTEQINREVVAQLLFNALFVEQDGTNVAESVFNVGATVVMITASNKVAYYNETPVTRTNYVRFQELDAQGEPTGAQYHVSYEKFDLANGALAADAAVGTLYAITYKNGCADVLAYEALTSVYENRGEVTNYYKDKYLYIDGAKLRVVTKYDALYNNQGWNADAAGTAEVKLYKTTGLTTTTTGNYTEYVIDSFKNIFKLTETGYDIVAHYSTVMNKYYDAKTYKVLSDAEVAAMFAQSTDALGGFNKVTSYDAKLAYADFYASDANLDGIVDRVAMKQYSFGKITYANRKNKDNKDQEYFQITTATETASVNALGKNVLSTEYNSGKSVGAPFVTDFRWTGMARADVAKDSYVIYYVDEYNKEVDILKVVDADAADGTYTVKGYLRAYNAADNTIYLDAAYTPYTIGYDNLAGAPLKDNTLSKANDNLPANIDIIQPLVNQYVTLVIVDNKVVMITKNGADADYVIIDSFVGFEEDGIVANAWTTVGTAGEYTQIKIAEINGWTVGGLDYTLYLLAGALKGDAANPYDSLIPVKADKLYQVVYSKDGVYNLTDAAVNAAAGEKLTLNEYGYIVGTDGKGKVEAKYYVQTAETNYWLILDTKGNVISYNGVLSPVVKFNGDVIKCKDGDYVLYVTDVNDKNCIDGLNKLSGKVTQYMLYNTNVSKIENSNLNIGINNQYVWTIYMQDVKTGVWGMVTIDNALLGDKYFNGLGQFIGEQKVNLVNGKVYAVVDGKLSDTTPVTFAQVCAYYSDNGTYEVSDSITFAGKDKYTLDELKQLVAVDVLNNIRGEWIDEGNLDNANLTELKKEYGKKVTLYALNGTSLTTDVHNVTIDPNSNYTIQYVYTKDGTAIGWVMETAPVVKGTIALTSATKGGVAGDDVLVSKAPVLTWADTENGDVAITVDWSKAAAPFESTTATYKVFANIDCSWGSNNTVDITATAAINTNVTVDLYDAINDQFYGATDVVVNYITVKVLRDGKADIVFTYEF